MTLINSVGLVVNTEHDHDKECNILQVFFTFKLCKSNKLLSDDSYKYLKKRLK